MKVFLDDFRTPEVAFKYTYDQIYLTEDWLVVKNYDDFVKVITHYYELAKDNELLTSKLPDLISFDHDLADEHYCPEEFWGEKYDEWEKSQTFKEKTGFECAKWLVEFCLDKDLKLCSFLSHSMNPVGKKNILSLLNNFKKHQKNENKSDS